MFKDDFLPFAPFTDKHENLYANYMSIYKDNIAISRSVYDDLIIIYNQKKREWTYISKEDIVKMIKGEHNYTEYDFNEITYIIFDNNEKLWALANNQIILAIGQDSIDVYTEVFNVEYNKLCYINSCYDLKIDKYGDIWSIIENTYIKDSTTITCFSLSKFKDGGFKTITNLTTTDYGFSIKKNIAFDNLNRVWFYNYDTLYVIENEEVIKKICIWDLPNGYPKLSKIVINSKNVVYTINSGLILYIIDGDNYKSDDYMQKIERYEATSLLNYFMCIDSSDNIWVTGQTRNLYKLDSSGNWTQYIVPYQDFENFDYFKKNIECDNEGKLWIISDGFASQSWGIYIFNPDTTTNVLDELTNELFGMHNNLIYSLYPNPATQTATLEFFLDRDVSNEINICLYNTLGMKVTDIPVNYNFDSYNMRAKIFFSVSDIMAGVYVLSASIGNKKEYRLLIVGNR